MLTTLLFAAALALHAPYIDTLTVNTAQGTTEYFGRMPTVDWRHQIVYMRVTSQQRDVDARRQDAGEHNAVAPRAPSSTSTWTFQLTIDGAETTVVYQCEPLIALGHGATVTAVSNCL